MVSQQLVEQWRARLAFWQQRLDEGRSRPWLARAYVRVLSFLLAQYASHSDASLGRTESGALAEAMPKLDQPTRKLVSATPDFSGKPPRSREDIRLVLEAVKAQVPHVEQGPLADGLKPDDPIVVAAFYSPIEVERLLKMFGPEHIGWQIQRFRRQVQIAVRMADLEQARPIVARHAVDAHDSARWRFKAVTHSSWRGFRVGTVVALAVVSISILPLIAYLMGNGNSQRDSCLLAVVIALCVLSVLAHCGFLVGLFVGVISSRHRLNRKWRP
jgi:hypothetical protein